METSDPTGEQTGQRAGRPSQTFPLEGGVSASLLAGLGLALVVEGVGLHVWTAAHSQVWAWTITAINLAALVWLWRDRQARSRAALTLGGQEVVELGNQLRCRFPRSAVASAEVATWRSVPDPSMARDYVNSAKPLEPNVLIVFRRPVIA